MDPAACDARFFDQICDLIFRGQAVVAVPMLAGHLFHIFEARQNWPETRAALHRHPLYAILNEDPFIAYSTMRPRSYPGDAGLIDMIENPVLPTSASAIGNQLFEISMGLPPVDAVRQRRAHAETIVTSAWQQRRRICVLACGYFREADALIGQDMSNVTLVDQDPQSIARARAAHGASAVIVESNVFRFLRSAKARGDQFDLIYTLGLTNYLDHSAMEMLHRLMRDCLSPHGSIQIANFVPAHLATGWMDAVLDLPLNCRDEEELKWYARTIGMVSRTWHDSTNAIAWCEMTAG